MIVFLGNYFADNVCWLTNYGLYFGFMLPVGLVLLFNLIIFLTVMTKLKNKKKVCKDCLYYVLFFRILKKPKIYFKTLLLRFTPSQIEMLSFEGWVVG